MTKKGFFKKYDFVYDEYNDIVIYPNNKTLNYSTTNREGYKEYKSKSSDCSKCELINKCTESKDKVKIVVLHVWHNYIEKLEDIRHIFVYKELYKKRSETIERVFADGKEYQGLRFTRFKGMEKTKIFYTLFLPA